MSHIIYVMPFFFFVYTHYCSILESKAPLRRWKVLTSVRANIYRENPGMTHLYSTYPCIVSYSEYSPVRMGVSKTCNLFVLFGCHFSFYPQLYTIIAYSFIVEKVIRCHDRNTGFRITNLPLDSFNLPASQFPCL